MADQDAVTRPVVLRPDGAPGMQLVGAADRAQVLAALTALCARPGILRPAWLTEVGAGGRWTG